MACSSFHSVHQEPAEHSCMPRHMSQTNPPHSAATRQAGNRTAHLRLHLQATSPATPLAALSHEQDTPHIRQAITTAMLP